MNATHRNLPDRFEDFIADPRRRGDPLDVRCLPRCDGGEWPDPADPNPWARHKLEFLAAYYHLNCFHAELAELRAAPHTSEAQLLTLARRAQEAIHHRDRLEDLGAPIGFDAEPEMAGPFTINVRFQHATRHVHENHRRLHPQEARVNIPRPDPTATADLAHIPGLPIDEILADLRLGPPTDSPRP